jgi:hypothetical protein
MDEILQKAKKGGYHYVKAKSETERPSGKFAKIVMEPEFWQALGKKCGWLKIGEMKYDFFDKEQCENPKYDHSLAWIGKAIKFHEINLTYGWLKAVEYLEEITK